MAHLSFMVLRCFRWNNAASSVRSGMFIARPGLNTPSAVWGGLTCLAINEHLGQAAPNGGGILPTRLYYHHAAPDTVSTVIHPPVLLAGAIRRSRGRISRQCVPLKTSKILLSTRFDAVPIPCRTRTNLHNLAETHLLVIQHPAPSRLLATARSGCARQGRGGRGAAAKKTQRPCRTLRSDRGESGGWEFANLSFPCRH